MPAPIFVTAPPTPNGEVALTASTPPASLPYLPGLPPLVGQSGTDVPTLAFDLTASDTGTVGHAMLIFPTTLATNGAAITACAIKNGSTALTSGLTVNSNNCSISGTPTSPSPVTQYILLATNSVGTSYDAHVTLSVGAASPHIYIADKNFGNLVCAVNPTTGLIGTCAAHTDSNYFISYDMAAVINNSSPMVYIAAGSCIVACTVNVATGALSCPSNSESLSLAKRATMHKNGAGGLFGYAIDNNGVNVCTVTNGLPGTCLKTNAGLTTPIATQSSLLADWKPEAIDFFTTSGGVQNFSNY